MCGSVIRMACSTLVSLGHVHVLLDVKGDLREKRANSGEDGGIGETNLCPGMPKKLQQRTHHIPLMVVTCALVRVQRGCG